MCLLAMVLPLLSISHVLSGRVVRATLYITYRTTNRTNFLTWGGQGGALILALILALISTQISALNLALGRRTGGSLAPR